jgi:hypothetical protein
MPASFSSFCLLGPKFPATDLLWPTADAAAPTGLGLAVEVDDADGVAAVAGVVVDAAAALVPVTPAALR